MTPDEMQVAIEAQFQAWKTGDGEGLAAGFAPDGEIVVPGKRILGRAALRAAVERFSSRHRDVSVALYRAVYGHDSAALEYRWEDTKLETGERYRADDAVWVDFEPSGLIRRWREYWDTETAGQ